MYTNHPLVIIYIHQVARKLTIFRSMSPVRSSPTIVIKVIIIYLYRVFSDKRQSKLERRSNIGPKTDTNSIHQLNLMSKYIDHKLRASA